MKTYLSVHFGWLMKRGWFFIDDVLHFSHQIQVQILKGTFEIVGTFAQVVRGQAGDRGRLEFLVFQHFSVNKNRVENEE